MDVNEIYLLYKTSNGITTDSRRCRVGSVFLALRGETFNGNNFAIEALKKGCSCAIVDTDPTMLDPDGKYRSRLIKVADTLQTYKDIARLHRQEYDIPVVAITGTNGKTTTKELLAAVLGKTFRVMSTQGNYNNDIGVPQTLLTLSGSHDMAVVEMGASHPGDIKTLAETADPTCGLITNVGCAHLQGFGDFNGVKKTKGELYDFLALKGAFAFLNNEDEELSSMARERQLQTVGYAKGRILGCNPYLNVSLNDGDRIRTRLIGAYNLPNVLAAVTVGRYFGIEDYKIVNALETYTPLNDRSQLTITPCNRLIVDAYNANPSSMAAAIENFRSLDVPYQKMLILGGMRELGETSGKEHQKVADLLADAGFSDVWLVGREFMKTKTAFRRFSDVDDVKAKICTDKPRGKYILIKGSHAARLYELPAIL